MRSGEAVPLLPLIHDGVVRGRRLDLDYSDSESRARRVTVDPVGLVAKAGIWYLVTAEPALFRVSRIRSCSVRPEPAARPDHPDLATIWAGLRERVEVRPRDLQVTITVRPEAMGRVRRLLAAHLRAGEPDDPVLGLSFAGLPHAVGSLLGLGTQIEVREPAALRTALVEAAKSVIALYRA
jgi:predicted DNA-binding transcriptional regulator YafY